jgi:hypothetical protein
LHIIALSHYDIRVPELTVFDEVIAVLEEQRRRIDAAIKALKGRRRGRPPAALAAFMDITPKKAGPGRHMSAAARRKISIAQKERWRARGEGHEASASG